MDANCFKASITADKPPKSQLNLAVASVLGKAIRRRQNDYATSIAEDNALLRFTKIQGRRRMAIEVRLGEKEILASSLDLIDKKVASLVEDTMAQDDRPSKKAKTACNSSARKR